MKTLKAQYVERSVAARAPLAQKRLTRKQELFVKELVSKDGQITKREAAINAGYPAGSAHVRASEMTNIDKCPHVVKAIRLYRAELDEKFGVNYQRHVRKLGELRDQAADAGHWSAAITAEKFRGQAEGNIYINKSEIRHGTIDSMSREEVLKALAELKESYGSTDNTVGDSPEEEGQEKADGEQSLVAIQKRSEEKPAELEIN